VVPVIPGGPSLAARSERSHPSPAFSKITILDGLPPGYLN
jgi:hypothetical protein